MGLYGVLVVTNAPASSSGTETGPGTAYPGVSYDAEVPLVLSEIDPVQNTAVNAAVNTAGFSETAVWSGQPGMCGNPTSPTYNTCYPPVVNYAPLYYLINGVAFSKATSDSSLFPISPANTLTGGNQSVLVRLVNAGVRMHVPSIVGSQTTVPVAANGTTGAIAGTTTASGFSIVAEDGNPTPGNPRVQSEVFMAAGKTFDLKINVPAAVGNALAVYDRQLSLSANKVNRDAGMLAYLSINGSALPGGAQGTPVANNDTYNSLIAGQTFTVADPAKGVIANDLNVYGVALQVTSQAVNGTVALNANGTFTYTPSGTATSDSFGYCANGTTTICATVTLGKAVVENSGDILVPNSTWTATQATYFRTGLPGVLGSATDTAGYPLTVDVATVSNQCTSTPAPPCVIIDPSGGFSVLSTGAGSFSFTFKAQNSQGVHSGTATSTVTFPAPSNLAVTVQDGLTGVPLTDYRWLIEEDQSFYNDPGCTSNPPPTTSTVTGLACLKTTSGTVPELGVNFHTSHMPVVAQGCTGTLSCESGQTMVDPSTGNHVPAVCDVGNGVCRPDISGNGKTPVDPKQVVLDPTKRYYISVLPGDAANPFISANGANNCVGGQQPGPADPSCGHSMGGAPIGPGQTTVTVLVQQAPFPTATLSVNVFEDDFPLNGEQDSGGGVDVLASNEPGLGSFNIVLWDDMGGSGDPTGQMTYDMFNQPLSNSLDGTIDPNSGLNACPITQQATGITGMITVCPKYESDGQTLSPLAGQAVVANLMPGRFGVQAIPGADRIARGEEWLQTNTLDGQKAHDSFIRIGEPAYFQEFGPASYHVSIGFANPAVINGRLAGVCAGTDANITGDHCNNTITGKVTTERMSRTPDERLYSSGSHDAFYWTQCYISFGDPDGEDFAFTKCNADGTFSLGGLPDGNWRVTVFDQWNDMLVDGLSTPVGLAQGTSGGTTALGDIATTQWQSNVYTRTFIDDNRDGVSQSNEAGVPLLDVAVRYRDGSLANQNTTDFTGAANFNETFPLFNWYIVETDDVRYKNTGTHTVYDAGGPADGSASCGQTGYPACGTSTIGNLLANTNEQNPIPNLLAVPGSVYCSSADCGSESILTSTPAAAGTPTSTTPNSTGRIDNPWIGGEEAWQGFSGQNNFIEFGKELYADHENGGIHGHVVYASTRPFDDPQMLVQTQWAPLVPRVTMNLYQEGVGADGITPTLKLVDSTVTSSWDDWAQGFHIGPDGHTKVPNMSCPGQSTSDLFYFSLYNQPEYLDLYNAIHSNQAATPMPYNAQFKCYDGMHNWNQLQPAGYDGEYAFPSITSYDAKTGKPNGTNCTICAPNHATSPTDLYYGLPMLPTGKYVVEVVPPAGYEIVKEEDKNILIGDNFIAPVTQQFGGLGDIFILPDQAEVISEYNPWNPQNPTVNLGTHPTNNFVPSFGTEPAWPCVGESRTVPDFISLFPQSGEVAPFAGAKRNLCDRKEVLLNEQENAIAKFYIFTSTHKASKFTGVITDDFTAEFDPFSPQFGEKFAPPNMPIGMRDWTGTEIGRVYADWWGDYDGMVYSSWEVNPPNPTGYSPNMMVMCMNDKGPVNGKTDPLYNSFYSQFCYELPFMPGQTAYLDTPVVPTSGFSAGYNHPDCEYPDATPAIAEVDGNQGVGPWASASGVTMTINALGDQAVNNYGYVGPQATSAPFNAKTITRHYGFGTRCTSPTAGSPTCNTLSSVTIGVDSAGNPVPATINSWSDTQITITVPATGTAAGQIPACAIQQQAQYSGGAGTAYCGELVVTAGNGKQSVDTVTVTVGGKAPTYVTGTTPLTPNSTGSIQQAIDAANPGDLIMIPKGTYYEMLLMWKPVRLQGVGAARVTIDANAQPAGKLDPWRRQVDCLFGLALNGQPSTANNVVNNPNPGANPFDVSGTYACGSNPDGSGQWTAFVGGYDTPQVDRLPLEGIVGWDTTVNGNLAQLLQEPTLMGAYEGAGITVLAKGVNVPASGTSTYYGSGGEATFPAGTTVLRKLDCTNTANPSNFHCNPSRIDGLTVTDASAGGGGIFTHAWTHNLEVSNNRVYGNIGTLSGGITIGQGEFPDAYLNGTTLDSDPGSCLPGLLQPANDQLPYCFQINVQVHNNAVTANTSIGDELFSATPAGAGGVSFCTGSDYYNFNYNWICGNMSTGDGGGVAHLGFTWNGTIQHNTILFNQSLNPTIPANGGGIVVMGAAPDGAPPGSAPGTECGSVTDNDCAPGLSDGTGPNLLIDANLIQGNAAEAGSGGGIRLQAVNGTDIPRWFNGRDSQGLAGYTDWNNVVISNNVITNNVAGWDGGGLSFEDALKVTVINNTIASNDTTATAGVLFNTLGAPLASSQSGGGNQTINPNTSAPQPAGIVTMQNSPQLTAAYPAGQTITCPPTQPNCGVYSNPYLPNNLIWQNRSFQVGVGSLSATYQQNIVTLYNSAFSGGTHGAALVNQATTGQCVSGSSYWDIGFRGDTGPGVHSAVGSVVAKLTPVSSLLTNASESTAGNNNLIANPTLLSQYCNGSRVPPEYQGGTWNVPPGISDATVPNPIFNLTPTATVDEGNNWVNMTWGPLSMVNPSTNATLGNYGLTSGSPAQDYILRASVTGLLAPSKDFYGHPRPDPAVPNRLDIGAIETQGGIPAPTLTSISPNVGVRGSAVAVTLTGTNLASVTAVTVSGLGVTVTNISASPTTVTATFTIGAAAPLTTRTVSVTSAGGTSNTVNFTIPTPAVTSISPTTGKQGTGVAVTIGGTGLTGATGVTVSGTGVTASGVTATGDTTVTATLNIAATAGTGNRNVSVTTPDGTSNTTTFSVTSSAPTLTNISPASGVRGTTSVTGGITLTGTNLANATAITVSGSGVTATIVTKNATTITATFAITAGAGLGSRNVTVTNPSGTSGNVSFTVTGATLTISAPVPALNSGGTSTKNGVITVSNGNGGNAGPFTFTTAPTIATVGTPSGTFSITGGTCVNGFVIPTGGSCTINVRYVPTTTTTSNANVTATGTGLATASQTSANFPAN
jgi:hypothetical protein